MSAAQLPLNGAKVVDLSRLLPGPWCSQTLGDMGAEVIKIEQPEIGDYSRFNPPYYREGGVYFSGVNRNKRSIALDFADKADRDVAWRLLEEADIVVESFREGVMEKFGLDYASVKRVNPDVIYCSVTGFGSDGPLARVPGHDLSIQGMTGQLGLVESQGPPPMPGFQAADYAGAAYAVISILGAYIRRAQSGGGCHLDIALYDSLMSLSTIALAGALSRYAGHSGKPELEVWGRNPRYATYLARDGKAVTVALLEARTWRRFCEFVGRPDLIFEESLADRHSMHGDRAEAFREAITEVCLAQDRDELVERMMKADIPICPVYTPDEAVASREAAARRIVQMVNHPVDGQIPQMVDPVVRAGLGDPTRRHAPALGEHSTEIRAELDRSVAKSRAHQTVE